MQNPLPSPWPARICNLQKVETYSDIHYSVQLRRILRTVVFLLVLAAGVTFTKANIRIPAEAKLPVRPGDGFDSLLFEGRNTPFEEPFTMATVGSSGSVTFEKHEVQHRLDIFRSICGGASGSYSWGTGSVEGSFFGLSQSRHSKSSYTLLLKVESHTGRKALAQTPRLNAFAKTLLETNPEGFLRTYGDHYIRSVAQGGRFFALVNIQSQQDETSAEIRASLSVSEISGDFGAFINSLSSKTEGRYQVSVQISWQGPPAIVPTLVKLEEFARNFPEEVRKSPVDFEFEAFPLLQHPEVASVISPEQLRYFDRRRSTERLYDAIRTTDLVIEDVDFLESISSGQVYQRLTAADRDLLKRARAALGIRALWLKDALYEAVFLARLRDLILMPGMPQLPFELTRISITEPNLLHWTAPQTGTSGSSPVAHGPGASSFVVELWVDNATDNATLWFEGTGTWAWIGLNGYHHRVNYGTGKHRVRILPQANYYVLRDGESRCHEQFNISQTGLDHIVPMDGRNFVQRSRRNGISNIEFWLMPIKVIAVKIITAAPAILSHPASQSVASGEGASLSVDAYGGGQLTIQWRRNGVPLASATNTVHFIDAVNSQTIGSYTVEVRNETGSVVSAPAMVRMGGTLQKPTILPPP